jgi:hypothetical protein
MGAVLHRRGHSMITRKGEYQLEFESNCTYDEAITYFEEKRELSGRCKKILEDPIVYKEREVWIIKQDIIISWGTFFRILLMRILNIN